jgi:hypothetical protein
MAALIKSIEEVLGETHPKLDVKKLREGDNILREEEGTKYVAKVKSGEVSLLAAIGSDGKESGTVIKIEPPVSPQPDHYLMCICDPDLGDHCWWIPYPGESGGIHRAD